MSCCQQRCCAGTFCCIAIIISIVLGTIVGVLFAFGLLPLIATAAWIAFGISILALIFLIVGIYTAAVTTPNALSKCLCRNIACLLAGIIGTLVTTIAALTILLIPVPLVIALVALAAAFFALLLINLIVFVICFICKLCAYHNELN